MSVIVLASAGIVSYYALNNPPIYLIPENWQTFLKILAITTWPLYVLAMVLPFIRASARAEKELASAYGESERLLLNILPARSPGA